MNATDWRTEQRDGAKELRKLLVDADLMQVDVAESMGIRQAAMSDYLNGRRQWPDGFEERFRAAVVLQKARR